MYDIQLWFKGLKASLSRSKVKELNDSFELPESRVERHIVRLL